MPASREEPKREELFTTPKECLSGWFDSGISPEQRFYPAQATLLHADERDEDEDELCPTCGAYWECECLKDEP